MGRITSMPDNAAAAGVPAARQEIYVTEILTGLGIRPPGSTQRMLHHQWAAILITHGGYRVGADPMRTFDAGAGDLVLMKPETEHVWATAAHPRGAREGLRAYWALFRPPPRLEPLLRYHEVQPHYSVVRIRDAAMLRRMVRCFREMLALGNSQLPVRTEIQFNLLEQALLWCANDQRARVGAADPRVAKVIDHMAANLARSLTTEELSAVAGISRSQLAVIFRQETQQTPMRYLERLRIERAMQLLRLATPRFDELAADVGFCDAKHLTRRFKLLVGLTPGEYRRRQRRSAP